VKAVSLRTARLQLRELHADDGPALFAIESDPDVVRYQAFEPFTAERARAYLLDAERDRQISPRQCFELAVVSAQTQMMIGRVGMRIAGEREASIWSAFVAISGARATPARRRTPSSTLDFDNWAYTESSGTAIHGTSARPACSKSSE
jgi:hypothetical protein